MLSTGAWVASQRLNALTESVPERGGVAKRHKFPRGSCGKQARASLHDGLRSEVVDVGLEGLLSMMLACGSSQVFTQSVCPCRTPSLSQSKSM